MSYKFQRLREKLRQAIASGELTGKLPGERELARRFHVNAKTLSKALTDLAAEGLLQRSIGRGTFVKTEESAEQPDGPWLLLCDADAPSPVAETLMRLNPLSQISHSMTATRPSFLNQFKAVVDLARNTPEEFIRGLVVRNIPVTLAHCEPKTYSTNAVLIDATLGATVMGRDLMLAGHRRFLAVEDRARNTVSQTLRNTASRYAPDASIDTGFAREVGHAIEAGITAIICESVHSASESMAILHKLQIAVPDAVSIVAIGCVTGDFPCSGYYVTPEKQAETIAQLIRNSPSGKPTSIWLTGAFVDRGTTGPGRSISEQEPDERLSVPALA
jgi:hypothetical protein